MTGWIIGIGIASFGSFGLLLALCRMAAIADAMSEPDFRDHPHQLRLEDDSDLLGRGCAASGHAHGGDV